MRGAVLAGVTLAFVALAGCTANDFTVGATESLYDLGDKHPAAIELPLVY